MESSNVLDITTLAAVVGMFLTVMAFSGSVPYRLGVLSNRVEQLRGEIVECREETRRNREELRQEMREMREENWHNHQQLLQTLAHHSHDQDTGFAIFRIKPGSENSAS